MAQFDIHPGPKGDGPTYLVDLQADLLGDIATTVVAPLYPIDAVAHRLARRLNPIFEIKGRKFAMMAAQLAAILDDEVLVAVEWGPEGGWCGEWIDMRDADQLEDYLTHPFNTGRAELISWSGKADRVVTTDTY